MTRLDTICDLVSENSIVCDIGCDHAYLLLKLYNKICKGFACDIAKKPLETARKTILENNISDKITPILSNGLESINKDTFDTLVIAGMGGETIISILEDCKYIKDEKYDIILQPMTKDDFLRQYLYSNGYSIIKEIISIEDRRIYTILKVKFTDIIKNKSIIDCILSTALTKDKDFDKFLIHHIKRIEIICNNIKKSQKNDYFTDYNSILIKLKEFKND